MTKFIEVTMKAGHCALVNIDHIIAVIPTYAKVDHATGLLLTSGPEPILDKASEVKRLIEAALRSDD